MLDFKIEKKIKGGLGRAGVIKTAHGDILTPAFTVVGTKATVKAVSSADVAELGGQAILSNTYHLYLQPGDALVKKAGGLGEFMRWDGPTLTDSGGFQAFSLGAAYGKGISKLADGSKRASSPLEVVSQTDGARDSKKSADFYACPREGSERSEEVIEPLAKIDEDGVTFKSHLDGSMHRFTPESSMAIQKNIGADITFAFDECTSPSATEEYQREAMHRTHRWAERSLAAFKKGQGKDKRRQSLYGIVQGGRHKELREKSARTIGAMDFDGFGIGGSFDKDDMAGAVGWVNSILPEGKPRHLLGIGVPLDIVLGIEQGVDTFDCVHPTRIARTGTVFDAHGNRMDLNKAKYATDFAPIDTTCTCMTCRTYDRAFLHHLFKAKELLVYRLASIHNLHYIVNLTARARQAILDGKYPEFKKQFLSHM